MKSSNLKSRKRITVYAALALVLLVALASLFLYHPGGPLNQNVQHGASIDRQPIPDTINTDTPGTPNRVAEDKSYLVLDEWKVKFKVPTGLNPVYYMARDGDGNLSSYAFTTKGIENLGGACVEPNSSGLTPPRTYLLRDTKKEDNRIYLKDSPIDGYFYYVGGSPYYCSNGDDDKQDAETKLLLDMLNTISSAR